MNEITNKCAKHGLLLTPDEGEPLRVILRRIIQHQETLPPVEIRQKHYSAADEDELRMDMDRLSDNMFEQAKMETDIFNRIPNPLPLFNSMLQMQLSSQKSDVKSKARCHEAKLDLINRQLRNVSLATEAGQHEVLVTELVILREGKNITRATTEVAIARHIGTAGNSVALSSSWLSHHCHVYYLGGYKSGDISSHALFRCNVNQVNYFAYTRKAAAVNEQTTQSK